MVVVSSEWLEWPDDDLGLKQHESMFEASEWTSIVNDVGGEVLGISFGNKTSQLSLGANDFTDCLSPSDSKYIQILPQGSSIMSRSGFKDQQPHCSRNDAKDKQSHDHRHRNNSLVISLRASEGRY
jgi:hypothetical protein